MNKHKEIKFIMAIIFSAMIVVSTIGYIYLVNYHEEPNHYFVEDGLLNLLNWDTYGEDNIELVGKWEFYPGKLINPNNIDKEINKFVEYKDIRKYVEVPGAWDSYLNNDGSSDGSGTYRLIIRVPHDGVYGIKSRTIRSASRIFLNGDEVSHTGNPSTSINSFIPESKYKVGFNDSLNKEIELVIQVSSYEYRTGGILKAIEFGTFDSIMLKNNRERAIEGLTISICLIFSVYFFLIYFQRGRERYLGYFSASSFFLAFYLTTMNEQLLDLIFSYDFITRMRIQFLAMIGFTVCFLKFTQYFFKSYINRKIINKITGIMMLLLIFVINNPLKKPSFRVEVAQISLIVGFAISYSYIFWILIRAIYHRVDSLKYILIITASVFSYWIAISIKILFEMELLYLPVFLIFIIMLGTTLLMSHRLQLDYQEARSLSEKLIMYDRLKDDFLAKTSHELRTPLHVINNLSKFLLEGRKGSLNSSQQEDLFFVNQEGQRLSRLVDDLLDASQIEKGEIKLILKPLEPYSVVENLVQEMKILIPEDKQVVIRNEIARNFPALKVDSDRFRQIIYNLIHNAIKYTEYGEIIISAALESGQAKIKIKDTGIGIKEKDIYEVFTTLYKNNEKDKTNQGLGLGLPIVKQLVEIHGGEIYVESNYNKGSDFIFTLPLYDLTTEEQQQEIAPVRENIFRPNSFIKAKSPEIINSNDTERYTILIVDDEASNQKVLSDVVHQMGFNSLLANNGEQALTIIKRNKVDLVILDIMLPEMSGDQVCKKIRKNYSMVDLPILILTASGRVTDLMNSFEYGANDFQKKPADAEELKSRIQSLLLMKTSVDEGLEKEFQYFYSQISPHFLYNTLNTIIGLSYKDDEKTRKALYNLSIYFRGKLDIHRQKGLIPLGTELELVIAYLEIEELRYGERLRIEYDIEEGLSAMIPPLTLQPLIENSVHHGIAGKNNGGTIKLSAQKIGSNNICITIEDDGVGITVEKQEKLVNGNSERMGLTNVVKKIKRLKGASFDLKSAVGKGTIIKIVIPEEKYHESYFD